MRVGRVPRDGLHLDDGLACTNDLCDGTGGCLTQQIPGTCLVGGTCYTKGDRNPADPCRVCVDGGAFSAADDGVCDDGDPCTTLDACRAGACVGGPPPDDELSDWLSIVVEGGSAGVYQVVHSSSDGIWVSGYALGPANFADGREIDSAEQVSFVARVGSNGDVIWTTLIVGADVVRLLASVDSPIVDVAVVSHYATTYLGADTSSEMRTLSAESGTHVVSLDAAGQIVGLVSLPALPVVRTPDGWIGTVPHNAPVSFDTEEGAVVLTPMSGYDDGIIRFRRTGAIAWARQVSGAGVEIVRDVALSTDGDIVALVGGAGAIRCDGASAPVSVDYGAAQHVLVRYALNGDLVGARRIIADTDWSAFGSSFDLMKIHGIESGATLVVGRISGLEATFGVAPNDVKYATGQFYSASPPEQGALGDGFVARFASSGVLEWVRFLKPLDAPDGYPGAELWNMSVDQTHRRVYATGFASGNAAFIGDGATHFLDLTPNRRVLFSLDLEGVRRWDLVDDHAPREFVGAEPEPGLFIVGVACDPDVQTFGGSPGPIETSACAAYVQRVGSAGGLDCSGSQ